MDQSQREKALNPAESFIVEAPAGSGKTELLTRRYLSLLAHVERDPEEIIALTFTKKAASEMKLRIIQALRFAEKNEHLDMPAVKLAQKVLKRDKQHHWQIIANPNRLRIMTIDALCMMLAYRTPILSHFGGKPDIHEFAHVLYQKSVKQFMLDTTGKDSWFSAYRNLLLAFDNNLEKLSVLLVQLLSKRDQWLMHVMDGELGDGLEDYLTNTIKDCTREHVLQLVESLAPVEYSLLDIIQQAKVNLEQTCELDCFQYEIDNTEFWTDLADLILVKDGNWRKSVTKKQGFLGPSATKDKEEKTKRKVHKEQFLNLMETVKEISGLQPLLQDMRLLPQLPLFDDEVLLIQSLSQILPILVGYLNLNFKESGLVDFTEMSLGALYALQNEQGPTDIALYLDYQLSHILVDEFQDTSAIQFQLLECLTQEWQPNEGRTIFLVGDPMQSIYRFRGAEVSVFLHAQKHGLSQIPLHNISLKQNFRTCENLVSWVNQTFSDIFPPQDNLSIGAVSYRTAHAAKPGVEQQTLYFDSFESSQSQGLEIVKFIQNQYAQNPDQSIAVLVRARRQLFNLLPLLQSYQIPFIAKEISQLITRTHVIDLLALLKALLNWDDRIAWLSVLRCPWVGLTLQDLITLADAEVSAHFWVTLQRYEEIENLSEHAKLRLSKVVPVISYWIQSRHRIKLSHWVKGLWAALGGPACYDSSALADIEEILNLMDRISDGSQNVDIELLEEKLTAKYVDQSYQDATEQLNSGNCVQLMTIHQSKGLEFDTVILPELQSSARRRDQEILNWHESMHLNKPMLMLGAKTNNQNNTIYTYINSILQNKETHELKRLFYVAMTRAKTTLFLSYVAEEKDEVGEAKAARSGSFLSLLEHADVGLQPVDLSKSQLEQTNIKDLDNSAIPELRRLPDDWCLPPTIQKFLPDYEFKHEDDDLNWPEQGEEWLRVSGVIFHQVIAYYLQNLESHLELSFLQVQANNLLKPFGLSAGDNHKANSLITRALSQMFEDTTGLWIMSHAHKQRLSEKAFSVKLKNKTRGVILDYAFIDEDDTRWIIDFKVNTATTADELDLDYEIETYAKQLELYRYTLSQIENNIIRCGLYFPVSKVFWELPQGFNPQ
tara:strand:- start:13015 stop:16359 length:3345 start_codon:yes stop_codon:yes gene_type:complete